MAERMIGLVAHDEAAALDAAAQALAGGRAAELTDEALRLVGGERLWERELVLQRLPRLERADRLLDRLVEALRDHSHAERRNAARSLLAALARPGSEAAERALARLEALAGQDADVDVRVLASTALGESANPAGRPALQATLHDPDPNVGAAAADALGTLGAVEAVEALADSVRTADPWVRMAAVMALGRLGDRRATPTLREALADPQLVDAAIDALGELGAADALDALEPQPGTPPHRRELAIRAAERILGARPDVPPPGWLRRAVRGEERRLAEELESRGDEAAAHLLGIAGTEDAADFLVRALETPQHEAAAAALLSLPETVRRRLLDRLPSSGPEARLALLAALPPLRTRSEIEPVVALLEDPDDPTTQAAAVEVLGRSDPTAVLPALSTALDHPATRHLAVRVLGYLGEDRCAPLAALLDDSDARVRRAAADGLARCATPDVRARILEALHAEADPAVRVALIRAIGTAGGPDAVPVLEGMLGEPDEAIRFAAVQALGRSHAAEALPALIRTLGEDSREIQAAALLALGELGDSRAAEPVARHLATRDSDLRLTAAFALRELATPAVVDSLMRALDDAAWAVRRTAAWTLAALGAAAALGRLRSLAEADPDPLVRETAHRAAERLASARAGGAA